MLSRTVDLVTDNAVPGVLQMYTRAADKIEAAVAVQLGRTVDVQG